jgi:hypothetical protein
MNKTKINLKETYSEKERDGRIEHAAQIDELKAKKQQVQAETKIDFIIKDALNKAFVEKRIAQIRKFIAKVDKLRAKMMRKKADTSIDYKRNSEYLDRKKQNINQKIEELKVLFTEIFSLIRGSRKISSSKER